MDELDPQIDAQEPQDDNHIYLPEGSHADAEDGEEVTATVKGTIATKEGGKCIVVSEVDGQPIESEEVTEGEEKPEQMDDAALSAKLSEGIKSMKGYK